MTGGLTPSPSAGQTSGVGITLSKKKKKKARKPCRSPRIPDLFFAVVDLVATRGTVFAHLAVNCCRYAKRLSWADSSCSFLLCEHFVAHNGRDIADRTWKRVPVQQSLRAKGFTDLSVTRLIQSKNSRKGKLRDNYPIQDKTLR